MYDKNNVFAKILTKQIPAKIVYEDDECLAFHDINPISKIHVLVITKGEYTDFSDFVCNSNPGESERFFRSVEKVVQTLNLGKSGYRLLTNTGEDARQEVLHFHMHILGGEKLGI